MTPKKTKGRQKIEMTKILDEKSLAVTFSKRHSGLFSKANELCTLCGVQLAIIMFSPTKKPFSYGNPSVEAIIYRYLEPFRPSSLSASQFMEAYHNANTQELSRQLTNMIAQLEAEKKTGEELDMIKKAKQEHGNRRDALRQTVEVEQLEKLKVVMLELKKKFEK